MKLLLLTSYESVNNTVLFQLGVADRAWLKTCVHWISRKTRPRNKFKLLEQQLRFDPEWIDFGDDKPLLINDS